MRRSSLAELSPLLKHLQKALCLFDAIFVHRLLNALIGSIHHSLFLLHVIHDGLSCVSSIMDFIARLILLTCIYTWATIAILLGERSTSLDMVLSAI